MSFVADYLVSTDANEIWMPATNGNHEWIQVDFLQRETVIQVCLSETVLLVNRLIAND